MIKVACPFFLFCEGMQHGRGGFIKIMILTLTLFFIPTTSLGDEYVLVMSKEDNLCQHMLNIYNSDMNKYGKVKYEDHKEFNWVRWEGKKIHLIGASGPPPIEINAQIALFDINNDSENEVIVFSEGSLSNSPTNDYDIFHHDDLEMLDEIVEGKEFYAKTLKSFSSADFISIDFHGGKRNETTKFPKNEKKFAGKAKISKHISTNKINFLKFNNRFYITFEERSNAETLALALDRFYREGGDVKTSQRSNEWLVEGFNELEKYSVVSECQKDNTLITQCLYLKKDKPAKRRAK